MGIFSKLEHAARDAQNMAGMAVEIGKLKLKIRRKQDEIKREKLKIGEIMWEKSKAGETVPPEVAEKCDKIRDHSAAVEILTNAVEAVKTQAREYTECCCSVCPDCGMDEDCCANYCSNCGTKLYEDDEACGCCECDCDCGSQEKTEHTTEE